MSDQGASSLRLMGLRACSSRLTYRVTRGQGGKHIEESHPKGPSITRRRRDKYSLIRRWVGKGPKDLTVTTTKGKERIIIEIKRNTQLQGMAIKGEAGVLVLPQDHTRTTKLNQQKLQGRWFQSCL
ncbi:unnamed protein product [Cochlearia groenlandica]